MAQAGMAHPLPSAAPAEEHPEPALGVRQAGEAPSSPGSSAANSVGNSWRNVRSSWRWPSGPGKLPGYLKAQFRAKTFGLLALQLAVVFCTLVVVECILGRPLQDAKLGPTFIILEIGNLVLLLALHCLQDRYPVNYVLLGAITLLLAARWSLGANIFLAWFHLQVVGILSAATFGAAAFSAVQDADGWPAVIWPLVLSWALGSTLDLSVALHFHVSILWTVFAIFTTFCLLVWLLVDVGRRLVDCNPDEFMRVVVAMNSTLLVVISIPIFAISTFLIHIVDSTCPGQEEAETAEGAAAV